MALPNPNYYHPDNDVYMSNSQWTHWMECPARAHAMFVQHNYRQPVTRAMAEGSLIDAVLTEPEAVQSIIDEYSEYLTKSNTKAAINAGGPDRIMNAYAETAMQTAEAVKQSRPWSILSGMESQVEFQFEIHGMAWKCRLDFLDRNMGYIWDGKKTASCTEERYIERLGCRGNFIAQYDYGRQLAVYREAVQQNEGVFGNGRGWRVGIVAYTCSTPSDIRMMPWKTSHFWQLDQALAGIAERVEYVDGLRKSNGETLHRCEACEYCFGTREDFIFPYADPGNNY